MDNGIRRHGEGTLNVIAEAETVTIAIPQKQQALVTGMLAFQVIDWIVLLSETGPIITSYQFEPEKESLVERHQRSEDIMNARSCSITGLLNEGYAHSMADYRELLQDHSPSLTEHQRLTLANLLNSAWHLALPLALERFDPKLRAVGKVRMEDARIIGAMHSRLPISIEERAKTILTALINRAAEATPINHEGLLEALWLNSDRYQSHLEKRLGNQDISDANDYALKTSKCLLQRNL